MKFFDFTFRAGEHSRGATYQCVLSGSSLEAALLGFRVAYPAAEITSISINRSARREFPAHVEGTCENLASKRGAA